LQQGGLGYVLADDVVLEYFAFGADGLAAVQTIDHAFYLFLLGVARHCGIYLI
jgi:hypothetical protein